MRVLGKTWCSQEKDGWGEKERVWEAEKLAPVVQM